MKRLFVCCLAALCLFPLRGQTDSLCPDELRKLVDELLPPGSEVGFSAYDLTADTLLCSYRADKLCRPASTMKLLTAITALSLPDAEAPFRTMVWHSGTVVNDTLKGDLYVVGGFDPEFDDEAMDSLVARVAAAPFSVVQGHVYGDVSLKDSLYWGNGWAWDDNPEAFQPYLSPLMFCKGVVEVKATPAAQGTPATVVCTPRSSFYTVANETRSRTSAAGKFTVTRNWLTNGNRIVVGGNVQGVRQGWVNVYNPAGFFMHTFLERLRGKGMTLPTAYGFAALPDEGVQCVAVWETPVQKVLKQLLKESDNLNGEALLCRIGAQTGEGKNVSADEGIAAIEQLMTRLGHDPKRYRLADGCGLSGYNYLSPALLVDFLRYAYAHESLFLQLYESLPVAGIDGTLKHRMKQTPAYRRIYAKTGSFTGINTLAGYARRKDGHLIAFAVMNQNVLSAARARALQDKFCVWLCR